MFAGAFPDPPIAAVCALVGLPLFVAAAGVAAFALAMGVRVGLLKDRAILPSKRAVVLAALAYVLQVIAVAFALPLLIAGNSHTGVLAIVPIVPTLAPWWLIRRAT